MSNILFKISGSIAAYKSCYLISRLVQEGHSVQTVASRSALEFVGPATLEGLTGKVVQGDTFNAGQAMQHIDLVNWADVTLLCPATANTLNKMASGIGDDLLSTLFLAHDFKKPYLIAPAMNTKMYQHPATQASMSQLKRWGIEILNTDAGTLACGEIGEGRLIDPGVIFNEIQKHLRPSTKSVDKPLDILITAGGTKEPIDRVRSITNTSTGETGCAIAETFIKRGHRVTYLHAQGAPIPEGLKSAYAFNSYTDLDQQLKGLLKSKKYNAVIHAAAVSDFSVDQLLINGKRLPNKSKLESVESLAITLKKNQKILPKIKSYAANPKLVVIGFKLTVDASPTQRQAAVAKVAKGTDLIVLNDLSEIHSKSHQASLIRSGQKPIHVHTKQELGDRLVKFVTHAAQQVRNR